MSNLLKKILTSPTPKKRPETILLTKDEFERISGYFQRKVRYEVARQTVNTINARIMFRETLK